MLSGRRLPEPGLSRDEKPCGFRCAVIYWIKNTIRRDNHVEQQTGAGV